MRLVLLVVTGPIRAHVNAQILFKCAVQVYTFHSNRYIRMTNILNKFYRMNIFVFEHC